MDQLRFARIRHDETPRKNPFRIYPETVAMNNVPKLGKGEVIPYPKDWETWTRALNSPEAAAWLFAFHSMLFNIESTDPYKAESITCGGNAVRVISQTADFVRISHERNDRPPREGVDFLTRPFLVQKVVCMDRETMQLRKPADGRDVYFPLLANETSDLWIAKDRIEFFPILPLGVNVNVAEIAVRQSPQPAAKIVERAIFGKRFLILDYRLRGSDVWGQVGEGRWIRLQHGERFYTTWTMQTKPPLASFTTWTRQDNIPVETLIRQ